MGITDYSFLQEDPPTAAAPQPVSRSLNDLVSELLGMEARVKEQRAEIEITKEQILYNLQAAQGYAPDLANKLDLEIPVDTGVIKIRFPEKWEWDADALIDIFNGHPIPPYVTKKLSITKANYERLSPTVKAQVDQALSTRVEDEPTLSVKPHKKEKPE